jgi:uncharacterized repeat protein (TIGR01451 family)
MKTIFITVLLLSAFLFTPNAKAQCTLNIVSTSNVSCFGGNDGNITVNIANATSYNLMPGNINNASGIFNGLSAGIYTITGTDNSLCTSSTTINISEPSTLAIIITSSTGPSCIPGCDGTASATATGGTSSYSYAILPSGTINSATGFTTNLCAGMIYTVQATDANGCTASTTVMMTSPPSPVIVITSSTNPTCVPGCDGTASITPIPGGTYSISPSGTINAVSGALSALCAGTTYTITVTDVNGCTGTTSVQLINQSLAPISILNQTNVSCNSVCDGLIQIILLPGINYSISGPGNPTINASGVASNLCAGYYAITATDSNACTTIGITITSPPPLTVSIPIAVSPSCSPGCDGLINVSGNGGIGPYTYNILPSGPIQPTVGDFEGLCGGTSYTITATDALGCTINTSFLVTASLYNPIMQVGLIVNNSSISSSPSGGTAPYQYSLNGSPFSTTNTFSMLCSGIYTLTIKDSYGAGCLKDTVVTIQAATAFPGGAVTPYIVNPTCSLSNNGMISLVITPANNYTYQWNTNQTTSYLNNIMAGTYTVQILSATNECVELSIPVNSVGTNCGSISGNVYYDSTLNCIQEPYEDIILGTMLVANPGNHITFTDASGNYAYNQLPYGTYTISHQNNINAFQTHCGNNISATLSAANPNQVVDFGDSLKLDFDYSVFLNSMGCFIIPNPVKVRNIYYYHNNPGYPSTGEVYAVFDSINHYVYSNPTHTNISGDTVFWNVNNITSNAQWIQVNFTFPTTYTTANTFPFTIGLSNLQYSDTNQLNNQINYTIPFCNSYDPNDKHVAPKGEGPNGNILASDLLLTYNINFQNTGNAPAYNIVIEDTLSDKLDITTFNVLQTSHPYQLEVVNNQIIKWKFYNIMLPDSTTNEPESHGHIHYQIRQKNGNQLGDVIKNKAYIYFDYNPPIITNETINTIYQPTGVKNTASLRNQVVIYPNPASSEVYIDAEKEFTQYTIYNQQMSVIESKSFPSTKSKKLNIALLSNGIYFIKTNNGEMKKLVVQK